MGFRVEGLGFGALGCRVYDVGSRVEGLRFRAFGFRAFMALEYGSEDRNYKDISGHVGM